MATPVSEASPIRWWLVHILIGMLVLPPGVVAQHVTPPPQVKADVSLPSIQSLKVTPLAGNGEMNDLERKVMAPLVVQVLDQNDRPVEGAEVVFRFPLTGPTAAFPNQKNAQTFKTDADGQAAATGWMANREVGNFVIQVTASRGNEMGSASVTMTNATRVADNAKVKQKSWWSSRTAKIVIIGGAAAVAVAVILVTRGGGKAGTSTTTVTAIPGSPTIGGPQ